MFKITDEVSGKFANMAVISTVMIVFHHLPRHAPEGVVSVYDAILQIHPIVLMAVPFFFLSSGFFLVGHSDEKKWWNVALIKRIKTLFTYLLVNLMYFPFVNYFANRQGGGILSALGFVFPRNPACGPMWYVRNLFFLFVLAVHVNL